MHRCYFCNLFINEIFKLKATRDLRDIKKGEIVVACFECEKIEIENKKWESIDENNQSI